MPNQNIVVLDLGTARSADDCLCGATKDEHHGRHLGCSLKNIAEGTVYQPIGWDNKPALGLSIGAYYSYMDDRFHWFDEHNLGETIMDLVDQEPTMVSFNGIEHGFPLMRDILRRGADDGLVANPNALFRLCDAFKELASTSYDILAEIWKADPKGKFEKGLNSLDAISIANGLGPKLNHGTQAPRDWAVGKHANVVNYCQDDILKTKTLFERIQSSEGWLMRGNKKALGICWRTTKGEWAEPVPSRECLF